MSKKPKLNTEDAEPDVGEAAVASGEQTAASTTASEPAPMFVSSMNNGTLAEANKLARAQFLEEQAAIATAREAAYALVNKMFGGAAPMHVLDAVFHHKVR